MDVETWSCQDVAKWLAKNGMGHYSKELCSRHKIDGQVLLSLTEADLRNPPLSMAVLGDLKRLAALINKLREQSGSDSHGHDHAVSNGYVHVTSTTAGDGRKQSDYALEDWMDSPRNHLAPKLEPEYVKTFLSFVYVFAVFLFTAFVMTIVHDRVPDMERYPPLPDIVLDSIPYIPWAFKACELCGVILGIFLSLILILHKHRSIISRRIFAITGTVFLLRCVTMFVTSLSVPGTHLQCAGKVYGSTWDKLLRAIEIWSGLGMSLTGVHTCGDYMFSGHTSCITLANFFITEYSPRRYYILHTASWVLNLFGIFFILAAHEHYSIDVFVAFYITSRLFLYYHSLANNRALQQEDRRVRVWFPMFSFFEENVHGIVPNEYEWPAPLVWLARGGRWDYQYASRGPHQQGSRRRARKAKL
ncbi:sphingomyelin synthase-related protein 1-like [Diadema antillarum]|uniref:sphingomyelin synthase-related protein 1-like n=1 Tax=Diadema antillarum TaxID=105358 RepID=UPI003A8A0F06